MNQGSTLFFGSFLDELVRGDGLILHTKLLIF